MLMNDNKNVLRMNKREGNMPINLHRDTSNLVCFMKEPSPEISVYFQFLNSSVEDLIFRVRETFDYPNQVAGTSFTYPLARIGTGLASTSKK